MNRYCPACDKETEQTGVYQKSGFEIVRCGVCGLGSTVLGADFDPLKIYDQSYFQGGHTDGYADYTASERVLRQEFAQSVRFLRKQGPSSGRLLEIGCAYGYFLLEARPYFQVQGLEVSQHAVDAAKARGLDVANRDLTEHFQLHPEMLDAVVLLDVVEHLDRPAELLGTLHEHLKPGGMVMLSTGDWSSALSQLMGQRWRLMTPPQHLYFFSPATLSMLLEKIGFEVVKVVKPWKTVPLGLMAYQVGGQNRNAYSRARIRAVNRCTGEFIRRIPIARPQKVAASDLVAGRPYSDSKHRPAGHKSVSWPDPSPGDSGDATTSAWPSSL